VTGDRVTVWCSTQGPYPLRGALAEMLGVPAERVRVVHMEGAGCYGQNGADDVAAMAILLAQADGAPVRLLWSRALEFAWEPKAAAMVMEVRAGLDEAGRVVAWDYGAWTPTHTARPRRAEQLLAAQWVTGRAAPNVRGYGGGDRNAVTGYDFPAQRVHMHWLAESPLHTSSFRALGGTANTFANEAFMDELAAAAEADPVEFRLRHLAEERLRAVLSAAAERADWQPRRGARGDGTGLGVACARYKNSGAYVATVARVRVDRSSGAVRVEQIVVAHDCGLIVNPDGVRNQVEGNVIQSLSRALKEEVQFGAAGVTSLDWETYPILTFSEVPPVEVVLIDRPDQRSLGAGEPATVTTAPAVANAIFDATGARVRAVPFTPERVRAALEARGG
jgi:CO/xanthine dehydrogenase Mo-binding subunit